MTRGLIALIAFTSLTAAQQPRFRSQAEAVILNVLVTDRNRPVTGLTATDFEVRDNGVKQRVLNISHETLPLDVTLVIDTSGSIHRALLDSLVRSVNRVREQLRPGDRVSVFTFNQQVRELVGLAAAESGNPIALRSSGGQTSLNDAIAIALIGAPERDRRQMTIVFTDGSDTTSFLTERAVMDVARRSQAALFVVAAGDRRSLPAAFLEELASTTGGLTQITPSVEPWTVNQREFGRTTLAQAQGRDLIERNFLRALEEFRTSYVIRYSPEGVERGGWHEVGVRVTKPGTRYHLRTRRGYMSTPDR